MSKGRRWLVAAVVVVVLASAGGAAYFMRNRGPEVVSVEAETVERRRVVQTVEGTGRIQPVTQVNISADVSAKITRLPVEEGDWVEKGKLLVELDRERYLAALESAEANLRAAEANVNLVRENMSKTEKDRVRIANLYERNLESQAEMDRASAEAAIERARHRSAVDQAAQARAALKQARDDLSKTRISAPMAGTISLLNKEVGEIALGSQFQEDVIMVVSNLAGMQALVDVDENDIVQISLGDEATIEVDALPDVELPGSVTEIANTAKVTGEGTTSQKTEFEVKIGITDPNNRLRPGMTASAEVITEVKDDVIAVPIQCVAVRTPEQLAGDKPIDEEAYEVDADGFVTIVWLVEEGHARARPVTTGIQSESHIEITSGLDGGETIVVGSYRAISRDLSVETQVQVERDETGSR